MYYQKDTITEIKAYSQDILHTIEIYGQKMKLLISGIQ